MENTLIEQKEYILDAMENLSNIGKKALSQANMPLYEHTKANLAYLENEYDKL